MADSRVILSIRDLHISFDSQRVFKDVNLDVHEDDFVVITTGVMDGATTLLKSILGLVEGVRGQIIFDGNDVLQATERSARRQSRQKIGLVYEAAGLISVMTVYQNIALPLSYHTDLSEAEIEQKINIVARDLEITELLHLEPNELNDTQTRIVNLARALVITPRLLLVDELEGGMSKEVMLQMVAVIQRYQQEHHFGVVMTSLEKKSTFATSHYSIRNNQLEVDYVRQK